MNQRHLLVRAAMMLLMTVLTVIGAWAQTTVTTEDLLNKAIADGVTNIQLAGDIQLSNYLNIDGKTVTIDLNGYTLSRRLSDYDHAGHVIWAHGGCNLTLTSSNGNGFIEGGMANNGGAIHISHGNKVTAENVTFRNNSALEHAGAIWNNGEFMATNCTFTGNSSRDVGAIYNSVQTEGADTYAGTATLTNCTFTGNWGSTGAGALANAVGNTVMTIDGCTITDNTAGSRGGGIWNGGTLNMKGKVTVTGNQKDSGVVSNVLLVSGTLITVTGSLDGSSIGVEMESISGTFTSGYKTYHNNVAPTSFFTSDLGVITTLGLDNNGEACLTATGSVYYIERSWNATNKKVVSTLKGLTDSQYKEVTSAADNEWFQMGGYSTNSVPEYYVVRGNVYRETVVVQGKNVHLILCDGAMLHLTGGLKLEGDHKLYIHSQSYGNEMGKLIVTNRYENAAGIGSAWENGDERKAGELVIYGGHIEATGGQYGAGIGSCKRTFSGEGELCNTVTVFGGYVKATGGESGAGIGGGAGWREDGVDGGTFNLYDGSVIANGGIYSAGVGGGGCWHPVMPNDAGYGGKGGTVNIYGGTLTATGGDCAAGIGSGGHRKETQDAGGTVHIEGGNVTAIGGDNGAGIGGGHNASGAIVAISGGTVSAQGGDRSAGIGGGLYGRTGHLTVTGGTVFATAGFRAIGRGEDGDRDYDETLVIGDQMMVTVSKYGSAMSVADADQRVYDGGHNDHVWISPCTHPSGITYTINGDGTHTSHCKHCAVSETAAHVYNDVNGTCICGYKDGGNYYTITIATSSNGTGYEGVGESVNVGKDKLYTLPVCSTIPDGYKFAGWAVGATSHNEELPILPNGNETLKQAGEDITVTESVSIFARYQALEISLADDGDNDETLYAYNGRKAASVTLTGRTFFKDGYWNTLCLPFDVDDFEGTPLDGATVMTLGNSDACDTRFDATTGILHLEFLPAKTIEAGLPYIVKWESGDNISNPVFNGVTIRNENPSDQSVISKDGAVTFIGSYSPFTIDESNIGDILYIGSANKIGHSKNPRTLKSCRAHFVVPGDKDAEDDMVEIKAYVLNFGEIEENTTEIESVDSGELTVGGWWTLSGVQLNGMPSEKGVYLFNGKKVVIQ